MKELIDTIKDKIKNNILLTIKEVSFVLKNSQVKDRVEEVNGYSIIDSFFKLDKSCYTLRWCSTKDGKVFSWNQPEKVIGSIPPLVIDDRIKLFRVFKLSVQMISRQIAERIDWEEEEVKDFLNGKLFSRKNIFQDGIREIDKEIFSMTEDFLNNFESREKWYESNPVSEKIYLSPEFKGVFVKLFCELHNINYIELSDLTGYSISQIRQVARGAHNISRKFESILKKFGVGKYYTILEFVKKLDLRKNGEVISDEDLLDMDERRLLLNIFRESNFDTNLGIAEKTDYSFKFVKQLATGYHPISNLFLKELKRVSRKKYETAFYFVKNLQNQNN